MGQVAVTLANRPQGSLSSNTEKNPKENTNAITLRSGRKVEQIQLQDNDVESPDRAKEDNKEEIRKSEDNAIQQTADPLSKQLNRHPEDEATLEQEPEPLKRAPVKPYVPPVPFPRRLWKQCMDKQFSQFISMFKKLHINIPFADALAQMPKFGKFMKVILRNKKKLEDNETVMLNEECSAILLNKLSSKLKDPGSFSIPCKIGSCQFKKTLCDLKASINLMSLSLFRMLGLGDAKQ